MNAIKTALSVFAIAIVMTACDKNPIPNKSISQDLSVEELAEVIKVVPEFGQTYEAVHDQFKRCSVSEQARFTKLTYRDIMDYMTYVDDESLWTVMADSVNKAHKQLFGGDDERFDNSWAEWRKKQDVINHFDRYVEITREYFKYNNYKKKDNYANFTVTPLQGKLDFVNFTWTYGSEPTASPKGQGNVQNLESKKVVSCPSTYITMHSVVEGLNSNRPDCYVYVDITAIGIDGEGYFKDTFNEKLPAALRGVDLSDTAQVELARANVIRQLYNPDYKSADEELILVKRKNAKAKFPEASEFMRKVNVIKIIEPD